MPLTQQEKATNRLRFEELGRGGNPNNPVIPSVDGAIDCTHIRLCHTKIWRPRGIISKPEKLFLLECTEDDPEIMILPYEPVPVAPPVQQPGGLAFRRELINRVFREVHDDEINTFHN
ncbi:hypothetical protein ANN_26691 [Periplaneta americana]|uniref:Uncharacterized protein n=1 Tax=Periplaneta americana TaxID=6978 RepID=A0ABQ8RZ02_PERAM|nr:hypothetical protein ANN_26691 [Periplaneta americana]